MKNQYKVAAVNISYNSLNPNIKATRKTTIRYLRLWIENGVC